MPYLLDTNACIAYINQNSPMFSKQLLAQAPDDIFICDVVKYELYYGAYKSTRVTENLEIVNALSDEFVSLPFEDDAARVCGIIRVDLQSKGVPIGAYDLQIAATAIANDLTLITHNTKEFSRVPGLKISDWI